MDQIKECPGCAMEIANHNEVCPICGYEFLVQPRSFQIAVWGLILLLLLWILF